MSIKENNGYNDDSSPKKESQSPEFHNDIEKGSGDRKKAFPVKSKIIRASIVSLSSILSVAIIGLSGIGAASLVKSGNFITGMQNTGSSVPANPDEPKLRADGKTASTLALVSVVPKLDAQQVYSSVKDSVVTIETYTSQSVEPSAEGSGIIMSKDGYIITNEHVIDGASTIEVVLSDSKKFDAKLVGSDLKTDLAALKIGASNLKAAAFGNSDLINVAEPVLAIGNPGGIEFSGSVTEGIVSAVNRPLISENGYSEKLIQTDAAINPGNSGGALVNMAGQVIGITSSKIAETGFEGMGFAIPINTAQPVVNDIIKYGYVTGRVKIGISVAELDSSRAASLGYPSGLLIQAVSSGSDAAAKGIKADDIITKINGTSVTSFDQLDQIESKYKAGDVVRLTVYRYSSNNTFDVNVKLAEDKGNSSISVQQSIGQ